jgi:hypothetical protein
MKAMSSKLRKAALAALLLSAMASLTLAQGPLHKRVNYSINANYSLRLGNYILPPGSYVLYQISQNDLNLFALYQKDMARAPIAMIRTTRINYSGSDYPEHTRMLLDYAESSAEAYPVIQGWTIPGEDGWQIISVVANKNKVLARVK